MHDDLMYCEIPYPDQLFLVPTYVYLQDNTMSTIQQTATKKEYKNEDQFIHRCNCHFCHSNQFLKIYYNFRNNSSYWGLSVVNYNIGSII